MPCLITESDLISQVDFPQSTYQVLPTSSVRSLATITTLSLLSAFSARGVEPAVQRPIFLVI
ncbi:hypothetical protein PAXRUDRAFT_826787 [Paxillus rubicundulus Ve08.2h10]|uniref:Unplaced genomic scaffold scaffold_206, whole genome shotgun sequence n=1 Tax=Paxillus rubicundulus Ve08.2h10 TaxID=930991 RepID=A0A0D0DZ46_9AGAM|nr:hypothetical protein PAXRUDRAFT_826787 [Paxillus rubicundulus Ve08.2h10]